MMNAKAEFTSAATIFGLPDEQPHEQVLLRTDFASGLRAILAVHSTVRGPAFGGCRMWTYAHDQAALTDALRLSRGMSMKNALADLPFGGGKAVILQPKGKFDRNALFGAFGRTVAALNGAYITAEDVGSTTDDMRLVQQETPFVSGIPRGGAFGGDPSPKTAFGVFVAIEQAVRHRLKRSLAGATVAVQGLGAVGTSLCAYLHDAGARLVVSDVVASRARAVEARFAARVVEPEQILFEPADVLAPCALGAILDADTVLRVRAAIVAGAANNQLATIADGDRLHELGVLYLPDFLINAGGIISVAREYLGTGHETAVMQEIARISERVAELMERSVDSPAARVAEAWAMEKLHG